MLSAFCLTAPSSGEGKTTLAIGLMRLLAKKYKVQAFKCGPDYVDTSYHKTASGNTSYNLDSWLMGEEEVKQTFFSQTKACDIAVVEGVMGLFDGKKFDEKKQEEAVKNFPSILGSTAHIAQILSLPLIMIIDCKGMAQSISAIVRGFQSQCQEYGLNLAGIIANNVGSEKHYAMLDESLRIRNLPPLLGYIPKNLPVSFKERQLGLTHIFSKNAALENKLDELAEILSEHIAIDELLAATNYTQTDKTPPPGKTCRKPNKKMGAAPKIGIAYDEAFCFYYPQNIAALKRIGYTCHFFSPLKDKNLPEVDALYFGGGYPEIYADILSKNTEMCHAVKDFAENDGSIFAECGGFMYLCSSLCIKQHINPTRRNLEQAEAAIYPLCNVIDAKATMGTRLKSLGYRQGTFILKPFFWKSEQNEFRAHEFHWSDIELQKNYEPFLKIDKKPFGIHYKNVFASYLHFYFAHLF